MGDIKPFTVAQLKASLADLPDEAEVHVVSYVPYAGDESKRGGVLVHAEGLVNEITGVSCLLWSAEPNSEKTPFAKMVQFFKQEMKK